MNADHEHSPLGGPCTDCVRQWIEFLNEREKVRETRLEKLVKPERSLEWLIRESHRRRNLRHDRQFMEMMQNIGWHNRASEIRPDVVVTALDVTQS